MPNLVSLTHPSLQILEKTQTGVFFASFIRHDYIHYLDIYNQKGISDFRILVNPLYKKIIITLEPDMILTWNLD